MVLKSSSVGVLYLVGVREDWCIIHTFFNYLMKYKVNAFCEFIVKLTFPINKERLIAPFK